jgi:hypothetical protein
MVANSSFTPGRNFLIWTAASMPFSKSMVMSRTIRSGFRRDAKSSKAQLQDVMSLSGWNRSPIYLPLGHTQRFQRNLLRAGLTLPGLAVRARPEHGDYRTQTVVGIHQPRTRQRLAVDLLGSTSCSEFPKPPNQEMASITWGQ